MDDTLTRLLNDGASGTISRRRLLQAAAVAVGTPLSAFAQGRCMRTFGSPACNTDPIPPIFEPTGWKTVSLDHLTFQVADYKSEGAFYIALMGWTLRSDDGRQAVLDIGDWGSVILKRASPQVLEAANANRGGRGAPVNAVVESFAFGIEPWNARTVDAELRRRGLSPIADNAGDFESFHVKDPDGFDLQIGNGLARSRRTTPANATLSVPAPFQATGWKTVWLDHLSFGAANYKKSVSFYCNLLGWKGTYDEGSQNECLIGDVGDIIIRGGNPLAPDPTANSGRAGHVDHISFGITPWDTDGVKAALEQRGLAARVDTSTGDEIHVAAFKSYHTFTPNGYNLQISDVTHATRLELSNAVRPRPGR